MLLGDFNARTSKLEDFVSKEGNTFINDITETSFQPKMRESFDNYINKHGKCLIEICKNCNLRILNEPLVTHLVNPLPTAKKAQVWLTT